MATINYGNMLTRKDAIHKGITKAIVVIAKPANTDDADAETFRVKDPQGGTATTNATTRGNNLDGWKLYTYANLGTAYGL